jgi:hypothetical protein
MLGQQITIRLFEELSQSAQGLVRFKYEVMTKRSPYYGKVDYIWAETGTPLRAGHIYRVRVNKDTRAPRVVKVLAEVDATSAFATGLPSRVSQRVRGQSSRAERYPLTR